MNKTVFLSLIIGLLHISNSYSQSINESLSWSNSLRSVESLQDAYVSRAIHINEQGEVLNGSESISNYWVEKGIEVVSADLIFETNAVYRDNLIYKIGSIKTIDESEYFHLLIEEVGNSTSQRKLEFISEKGSTDIDLSIIDQRRVEWIEYCNSHDAEGLVENLYTENAVYYNHRPVITGREALTQTYQYMNSPRYSLNLTPLHVEVVNESIIFEIGQCDGSYNGKYILVWQKDEDGSWSILMDSNI